MKVSEKILILGHGGFQIRNSLVIRVIKIFLSYLHILIAIFWELFNALVFRKTTELTCVLKHFFDK